MLENMQCDLQEPCVNDGTINILNYPWNTAFHGLAIVRTAQASLCLHVGSKIALGTAKQLEIYV